MSGVRSGFPALQLALFGGVTIQVHGQRVIDLPIRKAEALLIYEELGLNVPPQGQGENAA